MYEAYIPLTIQAIMVRSNYEANTLKVAYLLWPNFLTVRADFVGFVFLRLAASAMRTIDKVGLSSIIRKLRAEGQKI